MGRASGGPGTDARRVHAWVAGRVQDVAFRASTRTVAEREGLAGYVQNLADGRVEFVAQGPRDAVDRLLAWARRGPPAARVEALEVTDEPPEVGLSGFEVRPTRG